MKKYLLFLICILNGVVGQAELLTNRDFETGDLTGWSTFGQGWRVGTGADVQAGSYGVVNDVMNTDGDHYRGLMQNVPVTAGVTYSIFTYIRAVNIESAQGWLELQWLDSSGVVIGTLFNGSPITADQSYLPVSISTVIAPYGAVTASVRGIVYMPLAPVGDTDYLIFDTFSMVEHPNSLLQNRGFESGDFAGMNTFGQGWRIGVGSDADGYGRGAVNDVLTVDVDTWRGVYQNIAVEAGGHYAAWVMIRAVGVESSSSWLEIQWLNELGQVLSQETSPTVVADQSFTPAMLPELVAPAGAVTASVRGIVFMSASPAGGADFHIFDSFSFIPRVDLDIQRPAADSVVVRWSAMGARNYLAVSSNVLGGVWVTPQVAPVLDAGQWMVNHSASPAMQCYRLQLIESTP
jgi:hypothetical protein